MERGKSGGYQMSIAKGSSQPLVIRKNVVWFKAGLFWATLAAQSRPLITMD